MPDNLKQLFRPVAMSKPDNDLIAEVILFSEGFKSAKVLGNKLVEVFNISRFLSESPSRYVFSSRFLFPLSISLYLSFLASELLSRQQHYDWGLRALKTVLRGCGSMLQERKKSSNEGGERVETEIAIQALRLNTLSKLTFADSVRFDALVTDIFPGIPFLEVAYEQLQEQLRQSVLDLGLSSNENQVFHPTEIII